ncbi:hypothetical protein SBRCBS47491_005494 [Sporothrix bragantina]|uniref:Uncharacterized protein n=1 Tax=Sporothrix bragantina TaxID=671064 RepID=A0ABP0BXE9_9PEZI
MKAFKLKPAGTGSTNKSHTSRSQSITSATSTSISSSLAHAKHATSAAWSACKQGTRNTLQLGSSALHRGQPRAIQSKSSQQPRRVRRLFRLGRGQKSSQYSTLGEDYNDDDIDIFSGQPFRTSLDAPRPQTSANHAPGHRCDVHCDSHSNSDLENGPLVARFVFEPQHATSSSMVPATARHMHFAADEGESDDDEWWRD